jgi:hypothetical protein
MFCNPQLTTCVLFCLREKGGEGGREILGNFGRPRCLGTCKTRPRKKRGGALRARYQTALPPRRTASKTLPNKKIHRARALAPAHRARVAATQARAPARAVGRRNGGSNPERFPSDLSPQPKAFPTRNNFAHPEASLLLLLSLSPNTRTLLPVPPPGSLGLRVPPPEAFLTRNVFANPGLLLPPPPTQLDLFSSSSSFRCLPGSL